MIWINFLSMYTKCNSQMALLQDDVTSRCNSRTALLQDVTARRRYFTFTSRVSVTCSLYAELTTMPSLHYLFWTLWTSDLVYVILEWANLNLCSICTNGYHTVRGPTAGKVATLDGSSSKKKAMDRKAGFYTRLPQQSQSKQYKPSPLEQGLWGFSVLKTKQ